MASAANNVAPRPGYGFKKMKTLTANAVIHLGAYCVAVSGAIKEVAAATAGQTPLGCVTQELIEPTGATYTLPQPAGFYCATEVEMDIDAGDPVVDADCGKTIAFTDGRTVHKTVAVNDVTCVLAEVLSTSRCVVRIQ